MTSFEQAAISPAGEGKLARGFGPHLIRIPSEATGGRLGAFESCIPAGEGPPMHVHEREDEFFRVLDGCFAFWCNGTRVELEAGGLIVVPRGAVHRFQNIGDSAGRVMTIVTPGGFEGFFGAVEVEDPQTPQAIDSLAARFNLRFVPALAAAVA